MLTIHLHNLIFFAHHGLYEQEKILGNEFVVNVDIEHLPITENINNIHQTINYVLVYNLVKQRMAEPTDLLETIAQDLCTVIFNQFKLAQKVSISITKKHPPVLNFVGNVGVTFTAQR
jgi:7,8-dihydroneopterin aldolase/epimerase/oxygenase